VVVICGLGFRGFRGLGLYVHDRCENNGCIESSHRYT
jgi:hypothetical protein